MPLARLYSWFSRRGADSPAGEPAVGLALGGGFARGIAHVGVLRVFREEGIPIGSIAGVSAGSIVAAAYAGGTTLEELAHRAGSMRFKDVARWTVSRLGLFASERMEAFLKDLLKAHAFEQMQIPLAIVATDLCTGKPVVFRTGDVVTAIRASCAYPGLFLPIRQAQHCLVDGAFSMEVPALTLREIGAARVVSVFIPMHAPGFDPRNMFEVVNRCFQVMHSRTENEWRQHSDIVLSPDVNGLGWDSFESAEKLIASGEKAARAALPAIQTWLKDKRAAA
jgi:NTE family protein